MDHSTTPSSVPSTKRARVTDPIAQRVALAHEVPRPDVPQEVVNALMRITKAAADYVVVLEATAKDPALATADKGRLIAAIDAVLQSKDIATIALRMGHVFAAAPEVAAEQH